GAVAERGPVGEVLARPRTPFTAALTGTNLLPAVVHSHRPLQVETSWGRWKVAPATASPESEIAAQEPEMPVGQECLVRVRPAALELHGQRPAGPNSFAATVRWLEPAEGGARVRLAGEVELVAHVDLAAADPHWLS